MAAVGRHYKQNEVLSLICTLRKVPYLSCVRLPRNIMKSKLLTLTKHV